MTRRRPKVTHWRPAISSTDAEAVAAKVIQVLGQQQRPPFPKQMRLKTVQVRDVHNQFSARLEKGGANPHEVGRIERMFQHVPKGHRIGRCR